MAMMRVILSLGLKDSFPTQSIKNRDLGAIILSTDIVY